MADKVLKNAVDAARDAAIDAAGDVDAVGEHLNATEIEERLVTHTFACTLDGYRGWVWAVTVSRAPRGKDAAVCEAHLVPADDALLAPSWIPWAERIRPGDLEPSMVLPLIKEDARLIPGYQQTNDEDADAVAIWEFGLGRERVLAPEGLDAAADRWYRGSHGPTAPSAVTSTAPCESCAFLVPIAGSLRGAFGVCTNEWSPSDGKVVSRDHGCGAHSQTDVDKQIAQWPADNPIIDTVANDALDMSEPDPEEATTASEPAGEAESPEGSGEDAPVTGAEQPAEEKPTE